MSYDTNHWTKKLLEKITLPAIKKFKRRGKQDIENFIRSNKQVVIYPKSRKFLISIFLKTMNSLGKKKL